MATALRDISPFREERAGYSTRPPSRSMDIWIRGGLVDPKHCRAMGASVWLYLYLQSHAGFESGRIDRYTHAEAAEHLGICERTIRRWMDRLVAASYVTITHHRYHSSLEISKFTPQSTRLAERRRPTQAESSPPSPFTEFRADPEGSSLDNSVHPENDSVDIFGHPEGSSLDNSVRKGGQKCPSDRSNTTNVSGSRDRSSNKDRGRRQSTPPTAAFLLEPEIPPTLQKFHALLTGQRGYKPTPAHLAHLDNIAQKLPDPDLECEALKIVDWLDQPKNRARQCSFAFVANWLKRAQADAANRAGPATPRPPEIEDGETYYRRLIATGQPNGDDPRE